VIPNMQRLQRACRHAGIEVLYTTIESLTKDGRDRSLDYKITGFNVPKGSWDGRVIDQIAPGEDEIWLPKTSSSVFVSTHIDYILRNLGVKQLVISGLITDQCVESAIRDACDLGYLVTQVTDACTTYSQERHDNSIRTIKGYCRQVTTDALLTEIARAA
ncbi:MAG: isochorismatase family cysteine hydrolase, partial [Geminicoccaceae bacterium]